MKSLENNIILLTGAAGGLGREFTLQLSSLGAHLILTDLDDDKLQALSSEVAARKGKVLGAFAADGGSQEGAQDILQQATKISPRIDMLINNAGVSNIGDFADIPSDQWELLMQIDLLTPMRLCHGLLPQMKSRGSGHIVNISSVAGIVPLVGGAPYTASKHGIKGFSDALRIEYERYGVNVSSVHPFFTRTNILTSPRYGTSSIREKQLPDIIIETPSVVVSEAIEGIRKNKGVILPGATAKGLDFMRRYFPDLLEFGWRQFNRL